MQEGSPEPGYAIGVETCVRDVPAGRRGAVWLGWRSLAGEVKYNYTQSRKYDLAYKSIFVGSRRRLIDRGGYSREHPAVPTTVGHGW